MTNDKGQERMNRADKEGPYWAQDMSKFYVETGSLRPRDISRVLGDPRDCVAAESMA